MNEIRESKKTLLRDHKEHLKMHEDKNNEKNKATDGEAVEAIISRLINWKFSQALNYVDALKRQDSLECLNLLDDLWGDTGWDRGDTKFGNIIHNLVEFIRMKEGWDYKEFYDEDEEIDSI